MTAIMNSKAFLRCITMLSLFFIALSPGFTDEKHAKKEADIPANVRKVPHNEKDFRRDPQYNKDKPYSPEKQLEVYGGKRPVKTARPLIELGRKLFYKGAYPEAFTFFGEKNPWMEHFMIFGDWKAVVAYNENENGVKQGTVAFQAILELDLQLTSTERFHGSIRPFDKNGEFTRWDFAGDNRSFETELDLNFDTLFFEGDLGMMLSGALNKDLGFDMPIAIGFMPMLFQNGVWLNDAFIGAAVTVPALNVPSLDISNMDITFFAGIDQVDTQAVAGNNTEEIRIFGVAMFIETMEGYFEVGYGYTYDDSQNNNAGNQDFDYHNATIAFTRRYGGFISNSIRVIANFGQDIDADGETADGFLVLFENSFVTHLPSTLVPYANFFAGFNRPQKLAGAGPLFNTGINFETDGITGFPKLDDTAADTVGGAIGVEYLFNLDQQIVVEVAHVQVIDGNSPVLGDEFAAGIRYQLPISNATILRVDAMYGVRQNNDDIKGIRFEVRRKF